jgi:hypothetical protein
MATKRLTIDISDKLSVAGILAEPERARACYVAAHGAGAGMEHPFMAAVSQGLYERGVATVRYQFPYMERGSKRPDPAPIAHAAVRAAVGLAGRLMPSVPLIAGGKSFGARMTSQAQAEDPLPEVRGLAFLGFPLHPAKKPSEERARHLAEVGIPMLFLQGTRDALADMDLLVPVVERLGANASLHLLQDADHSFHVPVRSGRTDAQMLASALDAMVDWVNTVVMHKAAPFES